MAKPLVTDELWRFVEPLLPKRPARPKGGRPPVPDRAALTGVLFVLKTGIPWEYLPREMACGSGMTCWRRLRDWQKAGVWEKIHHLLLDRLRGAGRIDFSRAVVDSGSLRAVFGGRKPGRIQRIDGNWGASITSSPTPMASRWPRNSPGRTVTM
jgi:transposase